MLKPDLNHIADIERLVQHFYQQAINDAIIGFFFTDIARIDLPAHQATIVQFWQRQIFASGDYHGRPFATHLRLHQQAALTEHHFHRWLYLFTHSVDTLFSGNNAALIKRRATAIAHSMQQGLHNRQQQTLLQRREQSGVGIFDPDMPQP